MYVNGALGELEASRQPWNELRIMAILFDLRRGVVVLCRSRGRIRSASPSPNGCSGAVHQPSCRARCTVLQVSYTSEWQMSKRQGT